MNSSNVRVLLVDGNSLPKTKKERLSTLTSRAFLNSILGMIRNEPSEEHKHVLEVELDVETKPIEEKKETTLPASTQQRSDKSEEVTTQALTTAIEKAVTEKNHLEIVTLCTKLITHDAKNIFALKKRAQAYSDLGNKDASSKDTENARDLIREQLFLKDYLNKHRDLLTSLGLENLTKAGIYSYNAHKAFSKEEWLSACIFAAYAFNYQTLDSDCRLLYVKAALKLEDNNKWVKALKILKYLLKESPEDPTLYLYEAQIYVKLNHDINAATRLISALQWEICKPRTFKQEEIEIALHIILHFNKEKTPPDDIPRDKLIKLSDKMFKNNRHEEAVIALNTCMLLKNHESDPTLYIKRGEINLHRNELLAAGLDYSVAMWLHYQQNKKINQAFIDLYLKCRDIFVKTQFLELSALAHKSARGLMLCLSDKTKSQKDAEAKKVDAEYITALLSQVKHHFRENSFSPQAAAYLGIVKGICSSEIDFHFQFGMFCLRENLLESAKDAFSKALQIEPNNKFVKHQMALLDSKLNPQISETKLPEVKPTETKREESTQQSTLSLPAEEKPTTGLSKKARKQMVRKAIAREEKETKLTRKHQQAEKQKLIDIEKAAEDKRKQEEATRIATLQQETQKQFQLAVFKKASEQAAAIALTKLEIAEKKAAEKKCTLAEIEKERQAAMHYTMATSIVTKTLIPSALAYIDSKAKNHQTATTPPEQKSETQLSILLADYETVILEKLEACKSTAYLVGGTIRDRIMNQKIDPTKDVDIVTTASEDEIKRCFPGIERCEKMPGLFRYYVVDENKNHIKVEIWQSEALKASLLDDAKKRDFTINALFAGRDKKVLDPTGLGLQHLYAGKICTILPPNEALLNASNTNSTKSESKQIEHKSLPKKPELPNTLRILRAHYLEVTTHCRIDSSIHNVINPLPTLITAETDIAPFNAWFHKIFTSADAAKHFNQLLNANIFSKLFSRNVCNALIKDRAWITEQLQKNTARRLDEVYLYFIASTYSHFPSALTSIITENPLFKGNMQHIHLENFLNLVEAKKKSCLQMAAKVKPTFFSQQNFSHYPHFELQGQANQSGAYQAADFAIYPSHCQENMTNYAITPQQFMLQQPAQQSCLRLFDQGKRLEKQGPLLPASFSFR